MNSIQSVLLLKELSLLLINNLENLLFFIVITHLNILVLLNNLPGMFSEKNLLIVLQSMYLLNNLNKNNKSYLSKTEIKLGIN